MNATPLEAIVTSTTPAKPVAALLRNLIDYAGLFPPASLAMASAVTNYDAYLRSPYAWMLGRFIVPVARLDEFDTALRGLADSGARKESQWSLSALMGADVAEDVERVQEFNARTVSGQQDPQRDRKIVSVEAKVGNATDIAQLSAVIPSELETYFEVPLPNASECISAIAAAGCRAKIRTGGETADKFPSPEIVVEFIRLCAAANLPLKATAGLHHPLRSVHRLTCQPDSPSGIMHGFLNLFLAAAFIRAGLEAQQAVELLREESADTFQFNSEGVDWRGHKLGVSDLILARREFAISFGSCSFTEPIDDLKSLHLL